MNMFWQLSINQFNKTNIFNETKYINLCYLYNKISLLQIQKKYYVFCMTAIPHTKLPSRRDTLAWGIAYTTKQTIRLEFLLKCGRQIIC